MIEFLTCPVHGLPSLFWVVMPYAGIFWREISIWFLKLKIILKG